MGIIWQPICFVGHPHGHFPKQPSKDTHESGKSSNSSPFKVFILPLSRDNHVDFSFGFMYYWDDRQLVDDTLSLIFLLGRARRAGLLLSWLIVEANLWLLLYNFMNQRDVTSSPVVRCQ